MTEPRFTADMFRKEGAPAYQPARVRSGTRECEGCNRKISANKSHCLACSQLIEPGKVDAVVVRGWFEDVYSGQFKLVSPEELISDKGLECSKVQGSRGQWFEYVDDLEKLKAENEAPERQGS